MIAFDDGGDVVGISEPLFHDDETRHDDGHAAEAIRRLLEYLAEPGEAVESGRRCLVLAHVLHLPAAPLTVRELARALGLPLATAWRLKQRIAGITSKSACFHR